MSTKVGAGGRPGQTLAHIGIRMGKLWGWGGLGTFGHVQEPGEGTGQAIRPKPLPFI